MKQLLILIGFVIGALAVGFTAGYFVFNKKCKPIVSVDTIFLPTYRDTCLGVSIDSMEIYRTVRKGLPRRIQPVVPPPQAEDSTSDIRSYDIEYSDSLLNIVAMIEVEGKLRECEFDIRMDTLEVVKQLTVRDTIPVNMPPVYIPVDVVREVPVPQAFVPRVFGIEGEVGHSVKLPGKPYAKAGLFYTDRASRKYGVSFNTDGQVGVNAGIPLIKSRK